MKDKGGGMSNDIARLAGARLVSVVETDQERRLAEGLVKQATGGDRMAARYLHHEFFEFLPKFKLWLATNHKPRIRGTDNGIWRRIRLLPFLVTFLDPENAGLDDPVKDDRLKETLATEQAGILAWIVRGCIDWQEVGLQMPAAVQAATNAYREAQDLLLGFLTDRCDFHANYTTKFGELFSAYKAWCADNGETPVSGKTFGEKLDEKDVASARGTGGTRLRRGISLKPQYAQTGPE
jgi:putative DNA primase/helicase